MRTGATSSIGTMPQLPFSDRWTGESKKWRALLGGRPAQQRLCQAETVAMRRMQPRCSSGVGQEAEEAEHGRGRGFAWLCPVCSGARCLACEEEVPAEEKPLSRLLLNTPPAKPASELLPEATSVGYMHTHNTHECRHAKINSLYMCTYILRCVYLSDCLDLFSATYRPSYGPFYLFFCRPLNLDLIGIYLAESIYPSIHLFI